MKQYTTPLITLTVEGQEELLSKADKIVLTVSDDEKRINLTPTVEGDKLMVQLSQEQTAMLSAGNIYVEATILYEGRVFKTTTAKAKLSQAIREEVL